MTIDLSSKVVAVTGASSGIGEATALACAQAGAAVSLAARRADRIEALAERITAAGGRAIAIPTDVGDESQARAFVERTHSELGRLDVLVNNAGVMLLGPIENAPTEEWRRMIEANVFGVLYCTHAALGLMREQGSGHIVNVSSVAGRVARAGSGVCLPTLATRSWPMIASASTTASFDAYGGRFSAATILFPERTTITARSGFDCGSKSSRLSSVSTFAAMP